MGNAAGIDTENRLKYDEAIENNRQMVGKNQRLREGVRKQRGGSRLEKEQAEL